MFKRISLILVLPAFGLSGLFAVTPSPESVSQLGEGGRPLPNVKPPFADLERARQKLELKVDDVVDRSGTAGIQPYFESGEKQVYFHRDAHRDFFKNPAGFALVHNGEDVAQINCSGWIPEIGGGAPYKGKDGTLGELVPNPEDDSVTFTKTFYVSEAETSDFTYTLRSLGDGKLKLDWEFGLTQEELDDLPPRSDLRFDIILKGPAAEKGVTLNDRKIPQISQAELQNEGKPMTVEQDSRGGTLRFGDENSEGAFSVEVGRDYQIQFEESYNLRPTPARSLAVRIRVKRMTPSGSLEFDLGETQVADAEAPAPVAGVDFWKHDRTHVPLKPTRNLMPNPSFEQGLRYWTWRIRGGGGAYDPNDNAAPCYELSDDALFGHRALKTNATFGNAAIVSFVLPVVPGKKYTLSFFYKGNGPNVGVTPAIPVSGNYSDYTTFLKPAPSEDWQRASLTFEAKIPAERLELQSFGETWIDGIQVEEGDEATDFVSPRVEGWLVSADPDNSLENGKPLDLAVELSGEANLSGTALLTVSDLYREVLYTQPFDFQLDGDGFQRIPVPLTSEQTGTGILIGRIDYAMADGEGDYTDYYRFSVFDFLDNTHASKNLFGCGFHAARTSRGDDLGEMYKRWGYGSTAYESGELGPEFMARHGIDNLLNTCSRAAFSPQWLKPPLLDIFYEWEEMTPEREKIVEDIAFEEASDPNKVGNVWSFNTESDGHTRMALLDRYDEFIKLQMAARRGILRARPDAHVLPDGGTSGFQPGRGYLEMEKQLEASQGKVQWDGLAIHPYGRFDEMDESIQYLVDLDAKYNPGNQTPIYVNECSPGSQLNVPEWEKIAQYYAETSGRPSYDTGWREFIVASISARLYLNGLKYWPQVQDINQWIFRPFMDLYFAPIMMDGSTNTLGNLFGNPKFLADFAPVSEIKGMIFEDEKKCGVAAVWSNAPKVEAGLAPAPSIRIRPDGTALKFIDLMGNERTPEIVDGEIVVPLSPAPLFVKTAAGDSPKLLEIMEKAEVMGAGSVVEVSFLPTAEGSVQSTITNTTGRPLTGLLASSGLEAVLEISGKTAAEVVVSEKVEPAFGKMFEWSGTFDLSISNGFAATYEAGLDYFYIPRTDQPLPLNPSAPEWAGIPSLPITNYHLNTNAQGGTPGDLRAAFQVAWDRDNLYVRVQASDDAFIADPEAWEKNLKRDEQLWANDGSLEVYFDTFANGRSNSQKGYDTDDYRYDFFAKDGTATTGPCSVFRMQEVFMEYAGGPLMPTKEEIAAGGIQTMFQRNDNEFSYVLIFPQRYLSPFSLTAGQRVGFGLYIQDRDEPGVAKGGLSLATEPGEACNLRPDLWPIMILSDQTSGE